MVLLTTDNRAGDEKSNRGSRRSRNDEVTTISPWSEEVWVDLAALVLRRRIGSMGNTTGRRRSMIN